MEDILELYAEPSDPLRPRVCLDEKGKELLHQTRPMEEMRAGQIAREDYEYRHNGACNLFVLYDLERGYRHISVTNQRRASDCARFLKWVVDEGYPEAKLIRVVCDNLNIHGWSCLYQTFEPKEARRIARKLEFHFTPKHASWLNMVEIEIGVLEKQCLNRRLGELAEVANEVAAWEAKRNQLGAKIKWQFNCDKARVKLHKLYPSFD